MDNRRKKIVISKEFQYKYSLLVVALAVLLVNCLVIVRMLFPGDEPLYLSTPMTPGIAALECVLIAAICYGSLKASHRITGPVFVIEREVARLGAGDLNATIMLRDKDMFQAQAQAMNDSFRALRNRVAAIKQFCDQLEVALASKSDVAPLVAKLTAEISKFTSNNKT